MSYVHPYIRSSSGAGRASKVAGSSSEAAGWASEIIGRESEVAGVLRVFFFGFLLLAEAEKLVWSNQSERKSRTLPKPYLYPLLLLRPFPRLKTLALKGCGLASLNLNSFDGLSDLESLDLSRNRLRENALHKEASSDRVRS